MQSISWVKNSKIFQTVEQTIQKTIGWPLFEMSSHQQKSNDCQFLCQPVYQISIANGPLSAGPEDNARSCNSFFFFLVHFVIKYAAREDEKLMCLFICIQRRNERKEFN